MEKSNKYKQYKENAFYCSSISFHPTKKNKDNSLQTRKIKYEKVT